MSLHQGLEDHPGHAPLRPRAPIPLTSQACRAAVCDARTQFSGSSVCQVIDKGATVSELVRTQNVVLYCVLLTFRGAVILICACLCLPFVFNVCAALHCLLCQHVAALLLLLLLLFIPLFAVRMCACVYAHRYSCASCLSQADCCHHPHRPASSKVHTQGLTMQGHVQFSLKKPKENRLKIFNNLLSRQPVSGIIRPPCSPQVGTDIRWVWAQGRGLCNPVRTPIDPPTTGFCRSFPSPVRNPLPCPCNPHVFLFPSVC